MRYFDGPYLVMKTMSDVLYRVKKGPKSRPKVVHHDRLKAYHGPNVPDWMEWCEVSAAEDTEHPRDATQAPMSPQSVVVESGNPPNTAPVPAPAVRRPRRAVRPPVRMQDYRLN